MSDQNTEEEPSIEEILTSIRQIISDDDDEAPEEEAAPEPDPEPEEEVIELTEKVEEAAPEPDPEPEPEPEPEVASEPEPEPEPIEVEMQDIASTSYSADDGDLLTDQAEAAAYDAFSELAKKTAVEHGGITLEEIVRTELKPMLRDWLDRNLPNIIERLVQEELDRVAKRAMED
jgi:cell pole-organizing protein PopZ